MTRWRRMLSVTILGAGLLTGPPVAADEATEAARPMVLVCTEEASRGFLWDEEGGVQPSDFVTERYTVKIVSETQRQIALPGLGLRFFACEPRREGQPEIVTCTWQGQVFLFRDRDFTTA